MSKDVCRDLVSVANMFNSKFRICIMDCKDGIVCGLGMGGDFNNGTHGPWNSMCIGCCHTWVITHIRKVAYWVVIMYHVPHCTQ